MPERVPPDVAIFGRIRELSNSNAIQHDPENSLEFLHVSEPRTPFGETLPQQLFGNAAL
jgi:hypothetical protein